jgi:hypothetical protein
MAAEGCPVITQLLNGQQVRQTLDLCTVEGVTGGARAPGVSVNAALAPGRCFNSSDCKSDSLECNMALNTTTFTCSSATGVLSGVAQGSCVKTACQVCKDCLASAQPFALQQATSTNASKVAQDWLSYCQAYSLAPAAKCLEVATSISAPGAVLPGNLGKRAAGLCAALGQCSSSGSNCGGSLVLDLCTVQGRSAASGDMLMPGLSPTTALPFGSCFSNHTCVAPADTCDTSSSPDARLCTCSNGNITCSNSAVGTCTIASGGCSDCKLCITDVQPFVKRVVASASAVSTWADFCTTALGKPADTCSAIASSFNGDVNKFRRAGQLCAALLRCSKGFVASCSLQGVQLLSNSAAGAEARLDWCTAEGVTGGSIVPGVSATAALPSGRCQNDMQCGSADLQCDMSSTSRFCYCEDGTDFCMSVGQCQRTPCAVCNDCLDSANKLVDATRFMQDPAAVASAVSTWCSSSKAALAPSPNCSLVAAGISTGALNTGKRAGLLCQRMGMCDTATLPVTCKLASLKAAIASSTIKGGHLVSPARPASCFG